MPTQTELIAHGKTLEEIRIAINADALIYQDLDDLKSAIREVNPSIQEFEASCFNGQYVTGDIDTQYLTDLAHERTNAKDNHQATDDHHVADDQLSSLSH